MTETLRKDNIVLLDPRDNVAVVLAPLTPGTPVSAPGVAVVASQAIAPGHKIALRRIAAGNRVLKYGECIGRAAQDIGQGSWVHNHNFGPDTDRQAYEYATDPVSRQFTAADQGETFLGYKRPNGDVGTRNYVAVIATSNCSSHVVTQIADQLRDVGMETHGIDGVIAIPHQEGCGHSKGEDTWQLERTMAGMIYHPNVGAVLMVSLGCEVNQLSLYVGSTQLTQQYFRHGKHIVGMEMQSSGGTRKTVESGVAQVKELIEICQKMERTPQPLSKVIMGTNCGGSDAFSGISANPAVGYTSDLLVRSHGTSILAEIPECMGAEHLLTRRAADEATGRRVIEVVQWYRDYLNRFGAKWDDNPSPGNKEGGISNITEKSLGAVAKSGTSPLTGVFRYAERVDKPGFVLMNTPGYDPVSLTGIAAGGSNVIVFTTGRGSGIGFPIVPVIKISSNSRIAVSMEDNIDINAGTIIEGKESVSEVGERIFEKLKRVCSGEKTKSELLGHREFVPWRVGPVL
jgi:altronate dehydratase